MKTARPRVSVAMAVRNGARFLGEALESITGQTFSSFECVVVDDGSTDDSPTLLEQHARRDPRFKVVSREHRGLAASLNQAIALARGEFVARMDADDVSLPGRFETQVAFLDSHPQVAVVGTAARILTPAGPIPQLLRPPTEPAAVLRGLLADHGPVHASVMMRKRVVDLVGGYREVFPAAQDRDLWLRIAEHAELTNLPEPLLLYRLHEQQVSVERLEEQVLCRLVAVRAYEMRRGGEPDPLADVARVDRATALEIGIDEDEMNQAVVRALLSETAQLRSFGLSGAARRLADRLGEFGPLPRELVAERLWVLGGLSRAEGRPLQAATHLARALALRPPLIGRVVAALRRRRRHPGPGGRQP